MSAFQLSPIGKLFFASLLGWMMHDTKFNWKIKGNPGQIQAMTRAIIASKRFQDEMKRPGATVESVISRLNLKNLTAQQFQTLTGQPWPL